MTFMAESSNALVLLHAYNSSEESEDELSNTSTAAIKRKTPPDCNLETANKRQHVDSSKRNKLPLPPCLVSLFPQPMEEPIDNPQEHEGRIRSFPHERGNWSTFVYIPYSTGPVYTSFLDVVLECCKETVQLKPVREPHVSLTRTVVLRHHWIDSFVDSVKKTVAVLPSFTVSFGSVNVYCNEEGTRTFVGLTLNEHEVLISAVEALDTCLSEFKLPTFYKEPSFHMSVHGASETKEKNCRGTCCFNCKLPMGISCMLISVLGLLM